MDPLAAVFVEGSFEEGKQGASGIVGIDCGVTATAGLPGFFNKQVCHAGDKRCGLSIQTISRTDGIDAFMQLCLERQTKGLRTRADQESRNSKIVSKNELRRTTVLGLLMEQFEPGHSVRFLADFDGVDYEKRTFIEFRDGERAHGNVTHEANKGSSCQDVVRKNRSSGS